ncbi:MAG: amino acid permease [Bacteroidota bacterium]
MEQPTEEREFKREINLRTAIMIVIGSMIGSGIFIVSADIARTVGSPGHLLLVWFITGVLTLIGALSYGELAGMMPHAGGQYVYLRESYGKLIGFLYGWTLFMVIQTGTIAAVAVAFAKFTGVLIPAVSENNILMDFGFLKITGAQLLAIVSVIFLTWVNTRGLKGGKFIQDTFTAAKVLALAGLILLGITVAQNPEAMAQNWNNFWNASRTVVENGQIVNRESLSGMMLMAMIGVAMVGSIFSSDAWNNVTFTGSEIVNPKRTIPISLFVGTTVVTLLYILANVAYLLVLPVEGNPAGTDIFSRGIQFATNDRVGTAVASGIFGEAGAIIMAVLIMVSTFGCNNGLILSGARVYFAMAKDGLFFKKAGELNRNGVPSGALVAQGIWACILCLSGRYGDLLDYVVFAVLIFYILTIAGIFILRRKRPDVERPYKAFGYPILPALYIVAALAICIDLLIFKPQFTYPGLAIVLAGIPVFYIWRKKEAVT